MEAELIRRTDAVRRRLVNLSHIWYDLGRRREEPRVHLFGPEMAIAFLREQLSLGRLRNRNTRDLLKKEIKSIDRLSGTPGLQRLRDALDRISRELDQGFDGHSDHVARLVATAQTEFANGSYLRAVVDTLRTAILSGKRDPHPDYVLSRLQQIRIAHRLRGVDNPELLERIFFHKESEQAGRLHSTYPLELLPTERAELLKQAKGTPAYNDLLRAELTAMTDAARFNALIHHWERSIGLRTHIFAVSGLKGTRGLSVGQVEFYAPGEHPKIQTNAFVDERFGRKQDNAVNAAVTMPGAGTDEEHSAAARVVQGAIDILSFHLPTRAPIELATQDSYSISQHAVTSHYEGLRTNLPVEHRHDHAPNLDQLHTYDSFLHMVTEIGERIASAKNMAPAQLRITTALRAKSKGDDSPVLDDRLLNYWIAIESLLNSSGQNDVLNPDSTSEARALKAIPALAVNSACNEIGWEAYDLLRGFLNESSRHPPFPDLATRSYRSEEHVFLRTFLGTLDDWISLIPVESWLHHRIHFTQQFFRDNKVALAELQRRQNEARSDTILIYQLRNRIVHNAHFDSTGSAYFVARAHLFASLLLEAIFADLDSTPAQVLGREIEEAFSRLQRLKTDHGFNLLNDDSACLRLGDRRHLLQELASAGVGKHILRPGSNRPRNNPS
jgi:hypothetical protein